MSFVDAGTVIKGLTLCTEAQKVLDQIETCFEYLQEEFKKVEWVEAHLHWCCGFL